jgi:hypothetical protein
MSQVLEEILRSYGLQERIYEYRVFREWPDAVGEQVARHAWPARLQGKTLHIVVDSSPWMQELSLLKTDILDRLNARMGRKLLTNLRFRVGDLPETTAPLESRLPAALSPEGAARVEAVVEEVADPDLKTTIRHTLTRAILAEEAMGKRRR